MSQRSGFPRKRFFRAPNELFGTGNTPGWTAWLGPGATMVYCLILRRYDFERQKGLYESHASMARSLGITMPTLEKHLRKLLQAGLVCALPHGKRKHPQYIYVPAIPLPTTPENEPEFDEEPDNTQESFVMNTQETLVNERGIPKCFESNTQIILKHESEEAMPRERDTPKIKSPRRLIRKLNNNMSIDECMRAVLKDADAVSIPSQTQKAWEHWKSLWEDHYQRPYYRARNPENRSVVPKDKRNLRQKIEAVGLPEVIARMERCFEICDETFPCMQRGTWIKPISLNDFVNNHFFDQWIPQRNHATERTPVCTSEKLERALNRHAAGAKASGEGEL